MPHPSLDEFWTLLTKSGLVDAGAAASLRREYQADSAAGAATAKDAAAWLGRRGVLTRWQAKRLAIGNLGPFFLGDYRLLERHDREGDALLFTARHEPSGRVVSVVLLSAKRCRRIDVWTEIVQRTTVASEATDPMLSRTWSLEQHSSSRLIVCEHVEGTSLTAELEQHGPLAAVQAGVLVSQIARAVADLHARGGVHGGLSTDVLLREPPPGGVPRTGRVRLLQFPLVGDPHRIPLRPWNTDDELDLLGRSACFVAPELMLPGTVCDPRSDVYSIGAILSALLTGTPPCWEGDARRTLRRAAFGDGPAPLGPPTVTNEMATLVGYLMARDPAERYQTAGEAADAIAACLGLAAGAGAASVRSPGAAPPAGLPAAADAGTLPDLSDLGGGPPIVSVGPTAAVRPTAKAAGSASGSSPPGRRGGRQLRLLGGAVTLGILAATAALVWSRLDSGLERPPDDVARVSRDKPDAGRAPAGGTSTPSPTKPKPGGVEGWGVPEPPRGDKPTGEDAMEIADSRERPDPPAAVSRQVVVDDPGLPWASPTAGPRPRLDYLLPGSQLILLARPAALAADIEGELFLRALGPDVAAGLARLAVWCGCEPDEIELVQAGWQAGATEGEVLGGCAIRLVSGKTVPADEAARRKAWGATTSIDVAGEEVFQGKPFSFWVPAAEAGRVLVVAADAPLPATLPGAAGPPPPAAPADTLFTQMVRQAAAAGDRTGDALQAELPRELEELVALLDADRHVTLFGSPHYLLTQGRVVLAGPLAKLAEPIEEFFGDAVKAAALSAHFTETCYLELDAIATLDVPAKEMAPELAGHVEGLADTVELYCAALNPAPYGRVLVLRLPSMLRSLVATMRSGAEGKGVILNAYLPRPAGHNLALATELALAQTPGAAPAVAATAPAAPAATDALGKLERKITLVFAKDTLEKSIQMIADEIDVPMDIIGPDLQLEGITKNQSFGLEARDKPAREILLEILAKANPDGKLVYIVTKEGGEETILVTTRAAVTKRGDTLPPGLEAAPAEKKKP
jgi:hypothetical protein